MSEIFLLNNFSNFVPSINDFLSFSIIIILSFTFISIGKLISNTNTPFNFFIGWSFFYFLILIFNFYLKINLDYIIIIFLLLGIISGYKIFDKNTFFINLKNNKIIIVFVAIYIFLLLSSKTKEWDSFAFWGLNIIYLIENNIFPLADNQHLHIHGNNPQPFGSSLIVYTPSIFLNILPENAAAIFNFVVLFMFYLILKKYIINKNFNYILIILVFLNPFVINSKTFSLYNDFLISILVGVIYIIIYLQVFAPNKNRLINNNRFWISLFLLINLFYLIKSTGFIQILTFIIINLFLFLYLKKLIELKIFLLISILSFICFLFFKHSLGINSDYSFFRYFPRLDILDEILISSIKIFFNNKFFVLFYTIFFICLVINILKKKIIIYSIYSFVSLIFWIGFIILSYLVFFVESESINSHSFNRYLSQINYLILIYTIISFNNFQTNNDFVTKILNSKIISFLSIIIVIATPLLISEKLRRDLQYPLINISSLNEEIKLKNYKNILVLSDDKGYISHILKFYSHESKFNFYEKKIKTIAYTEKFFEEFDLILYITKEYSCYINKYYEKRDKYRCNNTVL